MICPVCENTGSDQFATTKDYNWGLAGTFIYLRCQNCGLVYQKFNGHNPHLSQLYPRYYGTHASGNLPDFDNKINTRANVVRAETLESFLTSGTLFDVGCGSGFFLEFMRRRGWKVGGLDPAEEHVAFARQKLGLQHVSNGLWPPAENNIKKVDAVSYVHVIEHLDNPIKNLNAAKDILLPDGLLFIETPNIKSWPARIFKSHWVTLDAPRHLNLFSPDNLRYAIEHAGYEVIHISTYSPSTMEYTESIRYVLKDLWSSSGANRHMGAENSSSVESSDNMPDIGGPIPAFKRMFHYCEHWLFHCINKPADLMGYGCNILALARTR